MHRHYIEVAVQKAMGDLDHGIIARGPPVVEERVGETASEVGAFRFSARVVVDFNAGPGSTVSVTY